MALVAQHGRLVSCLIAAGCMFMSGCSTSPVRDRAQPSAAASTKSRAAESGELGRGKASWYGPGFHGRRTASGERFDMNELTAAHRTLPFGTRVRVRNIDNGREVVVRINDRGPHKPSRIIDLSRAAADRLDLIRVGEASVLLLQP